MNGEATKKVFRGTIEGWQLHHLSVSQEHMDELVAQVGGEKTLPLVITGTVKDDPSGRFKAGMHMTTTLLTFLDEDAGYCETRNSIYRLEGDNGSDVMPDMGNAVLKIFY